MLLIEHQDPLIPPWEVGFVMGRRLRVPGQIAESVADDRPYDVLTGPGEPEQGGRRADVRPANTGRA